MLSHRMKRTRAKLVGLMCAMDASPSEVEKFVNFSNTPTAQDKMKQLSRYLGDDLESDLTDTDGMSVEDICDELMMLSPSEREDVAEFLRNADQAGDRKPRRRPARDEMDDPVLGTMADRRSASASRAAFDEMPRSQRMPSFEKTFGARVRVDTTDGRVEHHAGGSKADKSFDRVFGADIKVL